MSQPPMAVTRRKPLSSMCLTIRPIWSQCPASMIRGRPSGLTAAITLPCQSVVTLAANGWT